MIRWNSTKKRWKKAADEAITSSRFGLERDRLAAEVAKRVWVANGGREWADARGEGSLLALETLILPHLNDAVVRSALALRHVHVLQDSLQRADYEDARSLEAEALWAEEYLRDAVAGAVATGSSGERLQGLRDRLAVVVMAELKAAAIAAA